MPAREGLVIRHERNTSLPEILDRVLRYAPAQAQAMVDRGDRFSAQKMTTVLCGKMYKQFVFARPYADGVLGVLRAGMLVAFHFYVWLEFWHRSGVGRTDADDRYVARLGTFVSALDRSLRLARAPRRVARRLRPARRSE